MTLSNTPIFHSITGKKTGYSLMVIKSIVFVCIAFGLTFVISLLVAGLVKLVYLLVHKKEAIKASESK
jgi:hypothetical protein